jgi:hypothetical protein
VRTHDPASAVNPPCTLRANQEFAVAPRTAENSRFCRAVRAAIILVYLICCFSLALTRAPWYDEGFVVNPSYAWLTDGHPGISILDDSGPFLPFPQRMSMKGIREHIYAEMPLHTVFLAAWFKTLGFGLVRARMLTILCGLAVLLSWYAVVHRLTSDAAVALDTMALMAIDYGFVLRTSEARMDTLSGAFGFGALAVYLGLRERNFPQAVFLSHACVAASAFTHPDGGMLAFAGLAFAGLAFLTLYFDRERIRLRHFARISGQWRGRKHRQQPIENVIAKPQPPRFLAVDTPHVDHVITLPIGVKQGRNRLGGSCRSASMRMATSPET